MLTYDHGGQAGQTPQDVVDINSIHRKIVNDIVNGISHDLGLYSNDILLSMDNEDGWNLLHRLIRRLHISKKATSEEAFRLVTRLVLSKPELLNEDDGTGLVPLLDAAEFRPEILFHEQGTDSTQLESVTAMKRVEELVKKTCIGAPENEHTLEEKQRFLYWDNPKTIRKIAVDLTGVSEWIGRQIVDATFRMSTILFETTLSSVRLPYWGSMENKKLKKNYARLGVVMQASGPYIEIFESLWEKKVREISLVEVDDLGPKPHSNAAIRQSLNGQMNDGSKRKFEIKIFKWKKYDISVDTIYSAAPDAEEVHLYSSGNTAVLQGWAYGSEFKKMKNLRRVFIEIHAKDVDDKKDCKAYEKKLKDKLKSKCAQLEPEWIKIRLYHRSINRRSIVDQSTRSSIISIRQA
ncbi:hypothetical protein F4804DRAFT_338480, partial [Jackrogersella minutella]